ncbi:MAG: chromosome segregation protein SMC, partial [Candidatus Nephrothrix sp. EaCA]
MRITSIQLTNFKRFTDLIIKDIPTASKLVLLIGSNGSGKSSLFDAFEYINRAIKREALSGYEVLDGYFKKKKDLDVFVK